MHGIVTEHGEALCYSCLTATGGFATISHRDLNPRDDWGTVCDECTFILSKGGKWVDVGGD